MEGIEELESQVGARTSQASDVCHYTIFFPRSLAETIELQQALAANVLEFVRDLCDDPNVGGQYIWQRESFELRQARETQTKAGLNYACLEGATCVGESVEDEWWIVWLLRAIGQKWTDAVIQVHDNDGQFLLIEAADHLPNWLNPDNAGNRLWLAGGRAYLIPLGHAGEPPNDHDGPLRLESALSVMFNESQRNALVASQNINQAIFAKADARAQSLKLDNYHRTIAYLPDEIIQLLERDQALITRAVTTFYERDAMQLKACQYMRRFNPTPAHYASVRMTRSLYAQLASQRFYAPKPFERAGWLEVTANDDSSSPQSIESRRRDIGLKIACGFEMLYQDAATAGSGAASRVHINRASKEGSGPAESAPGSHLARNSGYLKYFVALTNRGYFRGESTGSSLYNKLEARAMEYWLRMQEKGNEEGTNIARRLDELSTKAASAPLPSTPLQEDHDSWLYLDEAALNAMLHGRPDAAPPSTEGEQQDATEKFARTQAEKLSDMTGKFSSFLEGQGGLEGAMFEDETFSDDDGSDSGDNEESDAEMVAGPSGQSQDAKERRLATLVPGLTDSEWGAAAANEASIARKRKEDEASAQSQPAGLEDSALDTTLDESRPSKLDMRSASLHEADKYDGVSSDEDEGLDDLDGTLDASDKPRALQTSTLDELPEGEEAELEFGEGEQQEFLKFAREALGLSEEQYEDILNSRKKRGAYVPAQSRAQSEAQDLQHKPTPDATRQDKASSSAVKTQSRPPGLSQNTPKSGAPEQGRADSSRHTGARNPRLDTFDSLMAAMDRELANARRPAGSGVASQTAASLPDGDAKEMDDDDMSMADLDAEVARALDRGEEDSSPADYTLIKNFLESFKSQHGLAGPVSNLFGRLDQDFVMPRDGQ